MFENSTPLALWCVSVCGSQRTFCGSWLSPSNLWRQGILLRLLCVLQTCWLVTVHIVLLSLSLQMLNQHLAFLYGSRDRTQVVRFVQHMLCLRHKPSNPILYLGSLPMSIHIFNNKMYWYSIRLKKLPFIIIQTIIQSTLYMLISRE